MQKSIIYIDTAHFFIIDLSESKVVLYLLL